MSLPEYLKTKTQARNSPNIITRTLFIIYIIISLWILLFKLGVRFSYMEKRSVNLIPFNELFFSAGQPDIPEVILNMVVFIPLGIYSGVLFKKWSRATKLIFFFLTTLTLELLQFFMRIGAFDITDIVTNFFGGLIGLMIFQMIEKYFNNESKSTTFINTLATIGTVLMISFLLFLKLGLLPVRYQ